MAHDVGFVVGGGRIPGLAVAGDFCRRFFVMRALGCVINDIADRKLDVQVARTKDRPLACGKISIGGAIVFALLLLLLALLSWLALPPLARLWALGGLLFAAVYPFAKRVMPLPQAVLGIAFGFGILISWAAVRDENPAAAAWLLMAANCVLGDGLRYHLCHRRPR